MAGGDFAGISRIFTNSKFGPAIRANSCNSCHSGSYPCSSFSSAGLRMNPQAIIRLVGIEKTHQLGDVEVRALRGVNLEVQEGSFVAIMGPSGSGKSTMLNLLGCLDRPTRGEYYLGGEDVSKLDDDAISTVRGKRLGFVFQSYNLIHELTVIENIHVPLFYQGKDLSKTYDHCKKLAELVGLADRLDHRPKQLSGGQQQR